MERKLAELEVPEALLDKIRANPGGLRSGDRRLDVIVGYAATDRVAWGAWPGRARC